MTKILVTGRNGQLARCLFDRKLDYPNLELICGARENGDVSLDLTDAASIRDAVSKVNPHIIINAAAYTAVDDAENEPELAMKINGDAPGILAEAASKANARLVHLSTDYVFDGEKASAYVESDQTNPIGVYGQSKLAGELNTRTALPSTCIVRTSWVYSQYGKNFLKTMLRLAKERPSISVVNDQWGKPTSANELADGLLKICTDWSEGKATGLGETFHLAGSKKTSWSDFARLIFELDSANGEPATVINDIATHEYPTLAARPKNSVLDCEKFCDAYRFELKTIEESINEVLRKID